jgi:O-antigen/teichoic acid export membrane protein
MTSEPPNTRNSLATVEKQTASAPKGAMANAGWNSFATLWSIAVGFLLTPVLIHNLGAAQYGILLVIWSVTGLLSITSFGMGEGTLRYVALHYGENDQDGVNRVLGSTLSLYVVICSAVMIVMAIAAPWIAAWLNIPATDQRLVSWLLRLAVPVFALGMITSTMSAIPQALHRYDITSKIGVAVSVFRGAGYILIAFSGKGILPIVLWDLMVSAFWWILIMRAVRRLAPEVRLLPSFSLNGTKEIMGFSVFSFLTWTFHTMHRESGKLIISRLLGAVPVAFLGAPDNISQRIHMVVASGCESLMPRFSATRDPKSAETLFWHGTWFSLALSLVLFIPFFILVPDFLALWINPEFARNSGTIGQVLALYLISQGAFAPVATYFRGSGKPWFVTVVILSALLITIPSSLYFIPRYGATGAAYAYLLGSIAPLLGVAVGGFYAFGRSSFRNLLRMVVTPWIAALIAGAIGILIRPSSEELGWIGLLAHAVCLTSLTGSSLIAADLIAGGQHSPSRQLLEMIARRVPILGRFGNAKRATASE